MRWSWTARRSNQSSLKEISPEYSLEGLTMKLKLQSFGHLMRRTNSWEKTLMLGKTEGQMRRGWQRRRQLGGITDSVDMNLSKLWEIVKDKGSMVCCKCIGLQKVGHGLVTEQKKNILPCTECGRKFFWERENYRLKSQIYTKKMHWRMSMWR